MPFMSMRIEDGQANPLTRFTPCCVYKPPPTHKFNSVEEYLNSSELKQLQQHLLTQDELPYECRACKETESRNVPSIRQLKTPFFKNNKPTETDIKEIDFFTSNLCNLSCIMCNPKFSSVTAAEYKKLGWIDEITNFSESDIACNAIKSTPGVEYITLSGGEFFYSKNCERILETVIEAKIPNVKITTNVTFYRERCIDLLKQIPNLTLRCSIDGTAGVYEFIRYPAIWTEVKRNILHYKKSLPDARVESVLTLQPLNVFDVFNWIDFCNFNEIPTEFQDLVNVDFSWCIFNNEEKQAVTDFILSEIPKHNLTNKQKIILNVYAKHTIPGVAYNSEDRAKSLSKIAALVKLRNQSTDAVFVNFPQLRQELLNIL